ncbi:MAG: VanZ family protein [Bacteroidales bacterium]|nr:VanZ family protein [Bacteroidales bacterium]
MIIIAIALFTPGDKLPKQDFFHIEYADKIVHFSMFLMLQLILFRDFSGKNTLTGVKNFIMLGIISLSYGLITEIFQYFIISEREASTFDLLADFIGIVTAYPVLVFFNRIRYQ